MSFSTIRDGLKTRLETISGLRAYDVWPDTMNIPAAIVRPVNMDYYNTLTNVATLMVEIHLLAASIQNGLAKAQDILDTYLDATGTKSIKAAIEGDKTLGGTVTTCHVNRWFDYNSYEVNGIEYLGCKLEVEIWV